MVYGQQADRARLRDYISFAFQSREPEKYEVDLDALAARDDCEEFPVTADFWAPYYTLDLRFLFSLLLVSGSRLCETQSG